MPLIPFPLSSSFGRAAPLLAAFFLPLLDTFTHTEIIIDSRRPKKTFNKILEKNTGEYNFKVSLEKSLQICDRTL